MIKMTKSISIFSLLTVMVAMPATASSLKDDAFFTGPITTTKIQEKLCKTTREENEEKNKKHLLLSLSSGPLSVIFSYLKTPRDLDIVAAISRAMRETVRNPAIPEDSLYGHLTILSPEEYNDIVQSKISEILGNSALTKELQKFLTSQPYYYERYLEKLIEKENLKALDNNFKSRVQSIFESDAKSMENVLLFISNADFFTSFPESYEVKYFSRFLSKNTLSKLTNLPTTKLRAIVNHQDSYKVHDKKSLHFISSLMPAMDKSSPERLDAIGRLITTFQVNDHWKTGLIRSLGCVVLGTPPTLDTIEAVIKHGKATLPEKIDEENKGHILNHLVDLSPEKIKLIAENTDVFLSNIAHKNMSEMIMFLGMKDIEKLKSIPSDPTKKEKMSNAIGEKGKLRLL